MTKEKVYARSRGVSYLVITKKNRLVIELDNQVEHPTYFRVTQPDRLDNEVENVIIQEPKRFKGYRIPSIDLIFLTEKEVVKELTRGIR